MDSDDKIKILICGGRDDYELFKNILFREMKNLEKGDIIIHGGCRGIDTLADTFAKELNLEIRKYPVSKEMWEKYGRAAGPMRNRKMLEENPDEVWAFHSDLKNSKGTRDTIITAHKKKIPVYFFDLKNVKIFQGDFSELY